MEARTDGDVLQLQPSRSRWLTLLVISLVFVAIGLFVPVEEPAFWVLRIGCVGFFGVGALMAALVLAPGTSGLTLDADGMTIRMIFRTHRVRWAEVAGEFRIIGGSSPLGLGTLLPKPARNHMVGFDIVGLEHKTVWPNGARRMRMFTAPFRTLTACLSKSL